MKDVYRLEKIKEFDKETPWKSAIITKEIWNKIHKIAPWNFIKRGKSIHMIFAQIPQSLNSKNKKRFIDSIKEATVLKEDKAFLKKSREKEIELNIICFLSRNYHSRDLDNLLKPLADALKGEWFEDDSQIKKINSEKFKITETYDGLDKRFFECIYCSATIL